MKWTPDHICELRALWGQFGITAARIAVKLGKTRNSVIGKANTLGLKRLNNNDIRHQHAKVIKHRSYPRTNAGPLAKSLVELKRSQCHWPLHETFCGAPVARQSYCAQHYQVSVVP